MSVVRYAAVDLGAESGRVLLGTLAGERVRLQEAHRFANEPCAQEDGLHWDAQALRRELLAGLRAAAACADGPVAGVGVDAWGCDYGLLDADGELLGDPFHYRDRRTEGVLASILETIPAERLYARTGTQLQPFNTLVQLAAERGSERLERARTLLPMPDLASWWLSGRAVVERTSASTTQLLDVERGEWDRELLAELELPDALLAPLVDAGTPLAPLRPELAAATDLEPAPEVLAVGAHDTASAVVAIPTDDAAYLSSGTWSLLGMELDGPVTSADALRANLTNERGVGGTTRLLRNVMGLWLLQECRRAWAAEGFDAAYERLVALADAAPAGGPLIDPDAPQLLAPGAMPERIAALCRRSGQQPPDGVGATVRCILESLACAYRRALEQVEAAAGRRAACVHVVGGGARNAALCRLTADVLERPVLAGPVEATALGNVMTQALAHGHVESIAEIRAVVAASVAVARYEPAAGRAAAAALYERFEALGEEVHVDG